MVLLTVTSAAKAAVDEYCHLKRVANESDANVEKLSSTELGTPIDHNDLMDISKHLVERSQGDGTGSKSTREWRLDSLLQGAIVYQPPSTPKPEPTSEYRALMSRLRKEEEQRQYELMISPPPPKETFSHRFPNAASPYGGTQIATSSEEDEVTYADINRQMALIINVLVSIIATSVTVWIAARRWEVPQRLGLSMCTSAIVAIAEVAIYMGYIRRIQDAKATERAKVEKKEVVETWVLDGKKSDGREQRDGESIRFRKGKHR